MSSNNRQVVEGESPLVGDMIWWDPLMWGISPHHDNPTKEEDINRGGERRIGCWKILGSKTQDTSRQVRNLARISGKGLGYLVVISAEPKSLKFHTK